MIYNGITVDENSNAKVCPICNNEETRGRRVAIAQYVEHI